MGETKVEITLRNEADMAMAIRGLIPESEIRQVTVTAKVDTGATTLYFNEEIHRKLGLEIIGDSSARVADGRRVDTKITAPVEIRWNERASTCRARVMPGLAHTLLGVIPLEDMDLMVDPKRQCVVGVHGDEWLDVCEIMEE